MSNLPDRRESPRRRAVDDVGFVLSLRVALLMYVSLPLVIFFANGSWQAFCLALGMLHWAFRPLSPTV